MGGNSYRKKRPFPNSSSSQSHFKKRLTDKNNARYADSSVQSSEASNTEVSMDMMARFEQIKLMHDIDETFGFYEYKEGPTKLGWLINMHSTLVSDPSYPTGRAGVDFYFVEENGKCFRTTVLSDPYFYVISKVGKETEVESYIRKKFSPLVEKTIIEEKEDLKMPNHLMSGNKRKVIKILFRNVQDLLSVRKVLMLAAGRNHRQGDEASEYATSLIQGSKQSSFSNHLREAIEYVSELREYDVTYYQRVAIDHDLRVGLWYDVTAVEGRIQLSLRQDKVKRAEPIILAFDIETTKLPLKFPDATIDEIMMISYMVDGQGYLITNRDIVSEDIEDFEYTPKPEYEGPFIIFNEENEVALLWRFIQHLKELKPSIIVTYNGDFFDWPFVDARSKHHGINLYKETGFRKDTQGEYKCSYAIHMDAYKWVKRDSYLPAGSQGLKAVTKVKLRYNPDEIDPEDMTRFATERPQELAQYSVSDAVATYYLYMKYVHPFIFSLCNIIPLNPDDVLRKGSGTLCESLLMVQAFKGGIIMPNKHVEQTGKLYDGHLLESETYIGGHVEALEAGVFRSDLPYKFKLEPSGLQTLIDQIDKALKFSLQVEGQIKLEDVKNYDEVKLDIVRKLEHLRDHPNRTEKPFIYHLDVGAMYPNIILTNRLQPDAIVDESMCAVCDFNRPGKRCQRKMSWMWRGEHLPAKRSEYNMIRNQLEHEKVQDKENRWVSFTDLSQHDQNEKIKMRLVDYCKKVYHKVHEATVTKKESIVCQRENPFYVNTVMNFRDRRYDYKRLHKEWKKKQDQAQQAGNLADLDNATKMVILYDSLQLAHKCILNSFYGYVMRKGARWYSMEMAGIVCLTGASIIQMARALVDQIGRPLELDTDGIWCILPQSFPENFHFQLNNGRSYMISYPCTMLNHLVHEKFTNDQYHDLKDAKTQEYEIKSENGIFFEVDGPYRAMILPSSKEENKQLKKRYAVFNKDGTLAELKGFEVKRRGELKLVKLFQSEIFKVFLQGQSLEECYAKVGEAANHWLDLLYSKGANMTDAELFDLISENRSMSKSLSEYGVQKSSSISTARRLSEFLGDQMVQDKGLSCQFIISERPFGSPVTERAIPVAIFHADPSVKKHYLRKWLKDGGMQSFELRGILDWQYYLERLGSVIQKLITIPAAMQSVANPVPRVHHPPWLSKLVAHREDPFRQAKMTDMFQRISKLDIQNRVDPEIDMEDIMSQGSQSSNVLGRGIVHKKKTSESIIEQDDISSKDIDMCKDYPAWLKWQKRKWRKFIENRKRFENESLNDRTILNNQFTRRTGDLLTEKWEVLQISEGDLPGEFKLWTMIGSQLYQLCLVVPRVFYINSVSSPTERFKQHPFLSMNRVYRHLPRSQHSYNLYECTMSESLYLKNSKPLSSLFCHPDVVGVYETNVPLLFRALLNLGCICMADKKKMKLMSRSIFDKFHLEELQREESHLESYLSESKLNYVYLHHLQKDQRQVLTLCNSRNPQVLTIVVGGNKQQQPNLKRVYQEKLDSLPPNNENDKQLTGADYFNFHEEKQFQMEFAVDEKQAWQILQKAINNYQDAHFGPTMFIVSSPLTSLNLCENVKTLRNFPIMRFPWHKPSLPALDWIRVACRVTFSHFFHCNSWITEQIGLARYCNVPVGNLEQDSASFLYDLTFGRSLQEKGTILWYSSSSNPDLGGREDDEHRLSAYHSKSVEISVPGCYENVCVSVELLNLSVNSVVESSLLVEAEGTTMASSLEQNTKVGTSISERPSSFLLNQISITSPIFYCLKGLLKLWIGDLQQSFGRFPSLLLEHFYRWISCPSSKFFDPALYSLVHSLMSKVLFHLMAEVRRRGSSIVYASFHQLIIATTKPTISSSKAYVDFLMSDLITMPIFSELEFEPVQQWEYLLWMDYYNFGGIVGSSEETNSNQPQVDMHWHIKEFLPRPIQDVFQVTVAEFIFEVHNYNLKWNRKTGKRVVTRLAQEGEPSAENIDDPEGSKKNLIRTTVTRKLLNVVSEIVSKQNDSVYNVQLSFPQLPGSSSSSENAALEFVKYLAHIFSLDKVILDDVRVLKRNLLGLIDVREFSSQAQFTNPSSSFIVPQVICTYCNFNRDMDICRDPVFIHSFSSDSTAPDKHGSFHPWQCPQCRNEFDKGAIEESIIDQFQRQHMEYQLQDLKCQRCRNIKYSNLSQLCECTGEYDLTISKSSMVQQFSTLQQLAQLYQLENLRQFLCQCVV